MMHQAIDSTTLADMATEKTSLRFVYDRISAKQLRDGLRELDMEPETFARLWGAGLRNVQRWLSGEQEAPPWVAPALALMREHPGNIVVVRRVAADAIREDRDNPGSGLYPFRREER